MSSALRQFVQSWLFLILAAGTLFLAIRGHFSQDAVGVLWLLGGMFTASFLQLSTQTFGSRRRFQERIWFDAEATSNSIAEIITADFEEVKSSESREKWEPSSEELLISDRTLALARVRIDIEKELRRLSFPLTDDHRVGLGRAADFLARAEVIPPALHSAIRDILPAANDAVHGYDVPIEQAALIVRLGDDVVRVLRSIQTPDGVRAGAPGR
ncbi:hypothetical protein [Sphingomonas faeni]|uniref:hypothetical protein n=1 Tax=Sphingomonas faeni TaxID=185950 RepID=UPI00334BEB10